MVERMKTYSLLLFSKL